MIYYCYCDAGYNNIKKENGYGSYEITLDDQIIFSERRIPLDIQTSNQAEFTIFLLMLNKIVELNLDKGNIIICYTDSELLENIFNGKKKLSNKPLLDILEKIRKIKIQNLYLYWTERKTMVERFGH